MEYEPHRLEPYFARALWGGGMERWRRAPWTDTSEAWEVSARAGKESLLEDGTPLSAYIARMGERAFYGREGVTAFPMLIKVIAPRLSLSVQVHPNEETCRVTGGESKTEAWFVLEAPSGAFLYAGLDIPAAALPKALEEGRIASCLHRVPVQPGDCISIPGGLVHALTPGVMVYEIQQSSDTTFRVYDWDRVGADGQPRALHLREAALAAADFPPVEPVKGNAETLPGGRRRQLLWHRDFGLDLLETDVSLEETLPGFAAYTVIGGSGRILWKGGSAPILRGETWLAPAACGNIGLQGYMKILKAYLP